MFGKSNGDTPDFYYFYMFPSFFCPRINIFFVWWMACYVVLSRNKFCDFFFIWWCLFIFTDIYRYISQKLFNYFKFKCHCRPNGFTCQSVFSAPTTSKLSQLEYKPINMTDCTFCNFPKFTNILELKIYSVIKIQSATKLFEDLR